MAFADKVVLITGKFHSVLWLKRGKFRRGFSSASSGIGAACAEYYAKEGAKLALVGRNAEKFESVTERIKESGVELEPLVILADVTVDAERIIAETIEKYERLDVVIINAGFMIPGPFNAMEMADFDGKFKFILTPFDITFCFKHSFFTSIILRHTAQMATNLRG